MNDYEKTFVLKMQRVRRAGIRFEPLAREALVGKFGGATEVLLKGVSQQALDDPEMFVKELSKVFGRGAMGVYEPIVKYVDMGLYSQPGVSPVLDLLRQRQAPTRVTKLLNSCALPPVALSPLG